MAQNCRKQKCNIIPNAKRTRDSFNFFSVLLYDLKFLFKRINDLIKLRYQLQTWNFHSQQLVTPTLSQEFFRVYKKFVTFQQVQKQNKTAKTN